MQRTTSDNKENEQHINESAPDAILQRGKERSTLLGYNRTNLSYKVAVQEAALTSLRLANALPALCPKESEEKKLLDAMLLAAPR